MRKILAIAILVCAVTSCSKKKDSASPDVTPVAAILTAPASNSTCTVGTVVSSTVSMVQFTWTASINTESYELTVKNLLDNTTTVQTTTATQLQVNLNRNTPYGWWVTLKSSKSSTASKSEVWKFYNSGIATASYAPFPADLTSPTFGQNVTATTGKITLSWNGSDVDNDIAGYDVYVGTSIGNMLVVQADLIPTTYNFTVTSGTMYYWKIVTKDNKGNTSISDVYQFKVN